MRTQGYVTTLALVLAAPLVLHAQGRPAYHFEPGAHWVYERNARTMPLQSEQPEHTIRDRIALWVLARQEDQWLLLMARQRWVDGTALPGQSLATHVDASGLREIPTPVAPQLPFMHDALDVLPVLPRGAQHEIEWATPPDLRGRYWRCYGRGLDAEHDNHWRVEFVEQDHPGVLDALRQQKTGTFWYDPAAGRIARWTSRVEDRRTRTVTSAIGTLRDVQTYSTTWCQRRVAETNQYVQTLAHEQRLLQELVVEPNRVERIVRELDGLWRAFRSDLHTRDKSPYGVIADARRQYWKKQRPRLVARARLGQRWHNERAAQWTLQDARGKTHTWESQRDRIMIECFWSASDAASLDTLAVLREMEADLPESRIGVLCFNMDTDLPDALDAIRHCGQDLTHLLGGPLTHIDPVPEYPVIRIVDRAGIVRGVWIGWRPSYPDIRARAYELAGLNTP